MSASTAHRCTDGGTLASSSPRVAVEEADLGEGDARAAADARLGRLEHHLEVLDRLLPGLLAKVLHVVGRMRVDLSERLGEVVVLHLCDLGEAPEDRLLPQEVRADLLVHLEDRGHAVHRRHVLLPARLVRAQDR
jgi:hypothetical protein